MHPVGKWLLSVGGGGRKEPDQGLDSKFLLLVETVVWPWKKTFPLSVRMIRAPLVTKIP